MVSDINPLLSKSRLLEEGNKRWHEIKKNEHDTSFSFRKNLSKPSTTLDKSASVSCLLSSFYKYKIPSNATAQKAAYKKIKDAKSKVIEIVFLFNLATDINI
ncbi:9196_t:CDS:2, partial [Dentiscutata heterogama]